MEQEHIAIARAEDFSNLMLDRIRESLAAKDLSRDICVVATGSFGRREASGESDVDFFLLHTAAVTAEEADSTVARVAKWIEDVVPKPPSPDGAFAEAEAIEGMLSNIGGPFDDNDKMTRRMLLLLEGVHLYNKELFESLRRQIVELYVRDTITTHQLARFLLNDVIRYYRTMCVDFEYKTQEQRKPWGIRNLKLLYSRKLLYFGGILAVAETPELNRDQKVTVLLDLFGKTPIERIRTLFGSDSNECLRYYDAFLAKLSELEFRRELQEVTDNRATHTKDFKDLKASSHHFSRSLKRLLDRRYPDHPIQLALLF